MLASKMNVLKPLIESNEGQHLTAYLKNEQNIFQLRSQLKQTLEMAYEYLAPVMNPDALVRFLAPIHNTIDDTKLLKSLKGNIGIFRNESVFRILSLPIAVEHTFVVATSFHVKPLLRWMQVDREFLLLGLGDDSASLYQGNQNTLQRVDTIVFPTLLRNSVGYNLFADGNGRQFKNAKFNETVDWLNNWVFNLTKDTKPQLFLAGQKEHTKLFLKKCKYEKVHQSAIWPSFNQDKLPEICAQIRSQLKEDAQKDLEHALIEFYQAEDLNLTNKNIFQIAKAAIKGRVRKLIIADGINIFGKINKKTGGLSIHPAHLDHEDDDILDDLAQEVLAQGGEVVVAHRDDIPKGRPILAILERADSELANKQLENMNHVHQSERRVI